MSATFYFVTLYYIQCVFASCSRILFIGSINFDIVNIALHISLKKFEQQCNGINIHPVTWIFISLRPPTCLSYPSNICGASLPEAYLLSTSISACYSNSSCSSARSLFSAVLSCNPYFFCRGCKTARSSFLPTYFRSGRCHDICLRRCSCFALLHTRSAQLCMKRLCTGFRGRNGVPRISGYAAAVFSTVAAHNSALMLSSIDSPTAVRS